MLISQGVDTVIGAKAVPSVNLPGKCSCSELRPKYS
jgi:hypothetical protein